MSNEAMEILIEEIMRTRSDNAYSQYTDEELREHYRKLLEGADNE